MRILKQSDPGPENSSRQSAPSSRFHGSPLPDEFSWSSGDNEESLQLIAGRFGDRVDGRDPGRGDECAECKCVYDY